MYLKNEEENHTQECILHKFKDTYRIRAVKLLKYNNIVMES